MLCKNFDDRTDRLVSRWTKDEQWDKRDQNPGEEKLEFSGHSDECATNKIDQPPPASVGPCGHTPHQTPHNATVAKHGPRRNSAGEKTDQSSQAD